MIRVFLILSALSLISCGSKSQNLTDKADDSERKEILNAIRIPVEKELKQKISFEVDFLNQDGSYAFLRGKPRKSNGKEIDYAKTIYRDQVEAGVMEDNVFALCKKKNGSWQCIKVLIGCTDVCYETWPEEYKLDKEFFNL